MEHNNEKLQLIDIYLAAYLQLRGVDPALLKQAGRVIFSFPNTKRVAFLIQEYNENPVGVGLLDFVQRLRRLRAMMLSMRD